MKVAILGCGPTGLLAAHACAMNGVEFKILSKKRKSFLFGSQYLHEPIPGISDFDASVDITYETIGSPVDYRRKVHGAAWDGIVEPSDFQPHDKAWNIREAYDRLWQQYGHMVENMELPIDPDLSRGIAAGPQNYRFLQKHLDIENYDLVVSTVPRTYWALPGDQFIHSKGWVLGDAPEHGQFCPFTTERDNMIVCDGTEERAWTRLSRVFGYTTIEWPEGSKPPVRGVAEIIKPLRFQAGNVEFSKNWIFCGRYGEWHKGILTTDAFTQVLKATGEKPEWILKKPHTSESSVQQDRASQ